MTHAVLACEGPHDQATLTWLARICLGWEPASDIPEGIRGLFDPRPQGSARTAPEDRRRPPAYLTKGGRLLIVREFGGVDGLLAHATAELLRKTNATGVGIVVDADDVGLERRIESFRTTYGDAFPHAREARAGTVWGADPRLGFWVAPDNESLGEMDDVLVTVAKRSRTELMTAGDTFLECARTAAPGNWLQKRSKALLGTVYQVEAPGASLASALERGKCWIEESITQTEPFGQLATFIDAIGLGDMGSSAPEGDNQGQSTAPR